MSTILSHNNDIIVVAVVMDNGGIGDCITRLIPLNYFSKHYPNMVFHVWVPIYFVDFAKRCLPNRKQFIIRDFAQMATKYDKNIPTYTYGSHRINNLATHLVDEAYQKFNTQPLTVEDKNYIRIPLADVKIDKFHLPASYAVLPTGFTAGVREWLPKHVNKVVDHLLSKGITPVFLGKKEAFNGAGHTIAPTFKEEIDYSKGINLIDQTTLVESAKIIEGAKLLVGLDNGLCHVAACTETPVVMGFTSLWKEHRLPYRYDKLGGGIEAVELTDQELDCRGCQSKYLFLYKHDFKECYRKDLKCLDLLDANKYIAAIDKILANYEAYKS